MNPTATTRILGLGSYVPSLAVDNKTLSQKVETSDEWILSRTGIRERRIAREDESTSDLALVAAQQALSSC